MRQSLMLTSLFNAVAQMPDASTRDALLHNLQKNSTQAAIFTIEDFITALTAQPVTPETLKYFLHHWYSMHHHGKGAYQVIPRLLEEAEQYHGFRQDYLLRAALNISRVLITETELHQPSEERLYSLFAQTLTHGQEWLSMQHHLQEIDCFTINREKFLKHADTQTAILGILTTEILNMAVYECFNKKIMPWMIHQQEIPPLPARKAVAYLHAHAGGAEIEDIQQAYQAWKNLSLAKKKQLDNQALIRSFNSHLSDMSAAYSTLHQLITCNQHKIHQVACKLLP
ncbi:MAG: hypothetical protein ACOYK8_09720 [Alphaproteobacteria bacterium]